MTPSALMKMMQSWRELEAPAKVILAAGWRDAGFDIDHRVFSDDYPDSEGSAIHIDTVVRALRQGEERLSALVEPWSNCHGDLPDFDHPLRCVFESGVEYAVQLLAKTLGVDDYQVCDGTEEYDGDLGGTLNNIVLAAMPSDEHGDEISPRELPSTITRAALEALANAAVASHD